MAMGFRRAAIVIGGVVLAGLAIVGLFVFASYATRKMQPELDLGSYHGVMEHMDESLAGLKDKFADTGSREEPLPALSFTINKTPDESGPLVLKGVVWNPESPLAFINKGVFSEGDEINGYRVQSIAEEHVILLDRRGHEVMLELYEE